MIEGLTIANLKPGTSPLTHDGEVFSLKTCQRTLIIGYGMNPIRYIDRTDQIKTIFNDKEAYTFLLETILGLQSEVIAEYEIVNQFRDAYQQYLKLHNRNGHLVTLIEKLFKDQKSIRSNHLMELGQLSYAGIARKLIHQNAANNRVLILGSGNLSLDLINLLKKKFQIYISARNQDKALEMAKNHDLLIIPWMDRAQYAEFDYIVNTVGTHEILLDDNNFFNLWQSKNLLTPTKLFIDLGSPSVINSSFNKEDGVFRLEDIFSESAKLNREKMEKVENAKIAVKELAAKRHERFTMTIPFGWEELQFA